MHRLGLVLATLALATAGGSAHAAGDPAAGARTFDRNCGFCHSAATPLKNKWGPALFGVVGRRAGTVAGYRYSDAMRASGVTWSARTLDAYLTGPQTFLPGVKMKFRGLAAPQDRADVIAFLEGRT